MNLLPRPSEGRPESFCPLDKELSWKSGSSIKKEPRLRSPHTRRRDQKEFTPALLRSASGELLPSSQRPIMELLLFYHEGNTAEKPTPATKGSARIYTRAPPKRVR